MSNRYILQKSTTQDGWWTLTDKEAGLVCRFKEHEFNETQKFTFLDADPDVLGKYSAGGIAKLLTGMADWGSAYYYNILMPKIEMSERLRIGRILKYHRDKAGLTVRELAEKTGFTYSNISKIEAGKYNVSIDILSKILAAIGKKLTIEDVDI